MSQNILCALYIWRSTDPARLVMLPLSPVLFRILGYFSHPRWILLQNFMYRARLLLFIVRAYVRYLGIKKGIDFLLSIFSVFDLVDTFELLIGGGEPEHSFVLLNWV